MSWREMFAALLDEIRALRGDVQQLRAALEQQQPSRGVRDYVAFVRAVRGCVFSAAELLDPADRRDAGLAGALVGLTARTIAAALGRVAGRPWGQIPGQ